MYSEQFFAISSALLEQTEAIQRGLRELKVHPSAAFATVLHIYNYIAYHTHQQL